MVGCPVKRARRWRHDLNKVYSLQFTVPHHLAWLTSPGGLESWHPGIAASESPIQPPIVMTVSCAAQAQWPLARSLDWYALFDVLVDP